MALTQRDLDELLEAHVNPHEADTPRHVEGKILDEQCFIITVKGRMVGPLAAERTFSGIRQITKTIDMHLILDLSECSFLSSFILGELCYMAVGCGEHGKKVVVVGANELIREVLSLTGVDSILEVAESLEAARDKFSQ